MTVTPDTKDWTWVLQRPCDQCGFDTWSFPREQVGILLRDNARSWRAVLSGAGVGTRPRPDVWSPLEYACHVRDAIRLAEHRLGRMLTEDDPAFPNWDQDSAALAGNYPEQDPDIVAADIDTAASTLADAFGAVSGEQWDRTGRRGDGANFTVETFARYFIHDPVHHRYDVGG